MLARRASVAISSAIFVAVVVVGLAIPRAEASAQPAVEACTSFAENGQRLRAAGKLIDARDKFIACSVAECPQVVRTDCAQWASEVLAATPTIVIDGKDANGVDLADAKVFVDDKKVADRIDGRPLAIDPGQHRIRIERTVDGTSGALTIVAKENAKAREVKIVLGTSIAADEGPREEKKSGGWGTWQFVGLGLTALGTAALVYSVVGYLSYRSDETTLLEKFNEASAQAENCPSSSPPESSCAKKVETREDLRRQYNENENEGVSDRPIIITFAVGGVALIAGGIALVIFAPKASSSSASLRGAPVITPQFAGMMLGGAF